MGGRVKNDDTDETTLAIELQHSRSRHLLWGVVGLGAAVFVAIKMGSLGLVLGAICAAYGLGAAWAFVQTLLHPPGTIAVRATELPGKGTPFREARADEVDLPTKLCSGTQMTLSIDEVKHAYLLRRALPWNQTGPVLVVETARGVFEYPRDWFAGDNDQRRIATALNRRLGVL
jgi:hypothetical protein